MLKWLISPCAWKAMRESSIGPWSHLSRKCRGSWSRTPSLQTNVIKRLYGVFEPEHVGLGLVGGGAAAGWKGFGWLALEGEDEAPNRQLSVEVTTELKGLVAGIEAKRTVLVDTKFDVVW
jgi:hypothetical protein